MVIQKFIMTTRQAQSNVADQYCAANRKNNKSCTTAGDTMGVTMGAATTTELAACQMYLNVFIFLRLFQVENVMTFTCAA